MIERISLEGFGLRPDGPTLTLSIGAGQSLAFAGPAGSGKTHFLRLLSGAQKPGRGSIKLHGDVFLVGADQISRRAKVQSVARHSPPRTAEEATELLTIMGLWDVRHSSVGDLSDSQLAATELVQGLLSGSEVVLIDGQLDAIDPWCLPATLAWVRQRKEMTVVVTTHRPEMLVEFDVVVVLKNQQVRFAGSPADLLRAGPRTEIVLTTRNQEAVKALVEPFEVTLRQNGGLIHIEATEGQELAARLLLEGYGDVKMLVVREPTFAEALTSL